MSRVFLLLLAAGCGFEAPKVTVDGPPGEAGPCVAWEPRGGHLGDLCTMEPAGSWRISSATAQYDTSAGTVNEGNSPRSFLLTQDPSANLELRVVSVDSFEIAPGASLRVVGEHPLLILSWSMISVDGMLDVSSKAAYPSPGAGGSRESCDNGDDGMGTSEAGGGGGGGLGQSGREGGDGNTGMTVNPGGGLGGSIGRPKGAVVGGCRGGNGGGASGSGGQGGAGGGAIQLTARTSITLAGRILAGGRGGAGASGNGGGGGGGSGGYIGLDAPLVMTAAGSILAANGGAGGAGCQTGPGAAGQDGQDMNVAAIGGQASSCTNGADGGGGGRRGAVPLAGANSAFSGGGGGGGAGYILVWAPMGGFMRAGTQTPAELHITAIEP